MPFYAVIRGRQPGIYSSSADCLEQTNQFPGQLSKRFDTFEEAKEFFQKVSNSPCISRHSSNEPVSPTLSCKSSSSKSNNAPLKYYTVAIGRKIGIFTCFKEARQSADGFPCQKIKSFNNKQDAIAFFQLFNPNKHPKIFSTQPAQPLPPKSVVKEEVSYFAVIVGRVPGIYTSSVECRKQTDNIPGQKSKKFKSYEAAKYFYDHSRIVAKQDASFQGCIIATPTTSTYYAVVAGFKPGIYTSVEQLKLQINNYPTPNYKQFNTHQEALAYMNQQHHSRHASNVSSNVSVNVSVSYASHLIYVRIPNPHLSKSILSTSKLDQYDWIKNGITSQSLSDRNNRINFQNDGGYFKYTVALNEREHCEAVESYFNEKFKHITIPGKTEYFNMKQMAKYYNTAENCESVADAHFHALLKCIMVKYPHYTRHIETRIHHYEIQVAENVGNEMIPMLKVDIVPSVYKMPDSLNMLKKKEDLPLQHMTKIKEYTDKILLYKEIAHDKLLERETFKVNFFREFVRGKTCEEIMNLGMLMSMTRNIWQAHQ